MSVLCVSGREVYVDPPRTIESWLSAGPVASRSLRATYVAGHWYVHAYDGTQRVASAVRASLEDAHAELAERLWARERRREVFVGEGGGV